MKIKVAIYEDNDALRKGLSHLIMSTEAFEFCGAYPDCNEVVQNCRTATPDVILMDIDMPSINGIEATGILKKEFPDIEVMMLTVFENEDLIFKALCAGATGYLLKKSSTTQIIEAIKELHRGGSPMTSEIARKTIEFFAKPPKFAKQENTYALSHREVEILECLVKGNSHKMVADACCISIGTVYTHINAIYKKLHVNSKSEAVIKAIKEGLV